MNKCIKIILLGLIILIFSCKENNSSGQSAKISADVDVKVLASGLEHVWEIIWSNDKLWITQRSGKISQLDPATGQVKDILAINDVESRGEGGLLGMALHPDFNITPEVFVVYNYLAGGAYKEKVVKYTFNGTTLVNPQILIADIAASNIHNGSRLLISADNKLFITTGDASVKTNAQDISSLNGKILRINLDGSIPSDNPFPQNPVWTFGHRNAQGLVFAKGRLYSSEHGPNNDDEINTIEKGRNYGWPNVEGKCNLPGEIEFCSTNNIVEPIYNWTPTLAVCGMQYYDKDLIPQFKNSLLLCTLKQSTLYQLKLNNEGNAIQGINEIISGTYGRLRSICIALDGKIYVGTSNGNNDKIIVIGKK